MRPTCIALLATAALSMACVAPPIQKPDERTAAPVRIAATEMTQVASLVEAGGVVRARTTAAIASRVLAPIVDVRVKAGDRVRRGDLLVTLDARDLRANDARARAATTSAEESVRAADADVKAADAAVHLAHVTHERIAVLQARRSATLEELDQATAGLSAAQAQLAAAQARLAAAAAGRDAAQASADVASVMATYAALTAPFDGIVAERTAETGSMAAPGTPLLTLEDPSTYRLEIRLDEARAALVSPGTDAAIRLDGHDTPITGHVVEMARVDATSHNFLVKIDLPAGTAVRSGQFGRASFNGSPRNAMTIPVSALVRRGQLTFVYLADSDQRAHLRPVSIGARVGDRAEILAGLRQGDHVVVSPPATLDDGDAVRGERR